MKANAYPVVEDDVVVFPNSVITGHITIGRGAVVGAGSIVLKDVPPGAKAVGNPARILDPAA
jgi:serine acetyltransferase